MAWHLQFTTLRSMAENLWGYKQVVPELVVPLSPYQKFLKSKKITKTKELDFGM